MSTAAAAAPTNKSVWNNWPHFIAGFAAGGTETFFSHPIDTYKVRVQTRVHDGVGIGASYRQGFSVREISSLYRGIGPALSRGIIAGALFLGSNEYFKVVLGASDNDQFSLPFLGAATLTGVVETLIYSPFELLKTQLQVGNHKTSRQGVAALYQTGGIRALYLGLTPLLGSHCMGNVGFFVSYGLIQKHLGGTRDKGTPSVLSTTLAGGVAGGMYYLVGHPLDTVQACMMAQRYPRERFANTRDCIQYLLRQPGGWRVMFRGVVPNILQAIPGGASSMLAFEAALPFLLKYRDGDNAAKNLE